MSILLTILKIIGIGILVILGIIILLVLLVLFVPVRYKAGGSYMDSRADVFGKASWLIGMVSVTFCYQNKQPFHIRANVFCIPVFDNLKKRKQKKKKFRKHKKEEPQLQAASVPGGIAEQNEPDTAEARTEKDTNSEPLAKEMEGRTADEVEASEIEKEKTDKITFFQKIQDIFIKFIEFFENFKFTFQKMYVIIMEIKDNIKYYLELLQQESTKRVLALCKKQLLRILKNLCPQKYSVNLHLGFGDPAVLGNVLAVWGMLYPLHMGRIDIRPEFEQEIMEGAFSLKGRLRICVLAWTAWLFFTDKNIKQLNI